MGLLENLLTGIAGGQAGASQPQGNSQPGFGLGGGLSSAVVPVLLSMLANNQAGGGAGSPLAGLIGRFEQAGLGHVAQSWVGSGSNQPVTPEQLHGVLGKEQVKDMSNQTGMAPHDLLSEIAQVLPGLIDKLTPNGQLPNTAETASSQLAHI